MRHAILTTILALCACAPADSIAPPGPADARRDYDAIRARARDAVILWQAAGGQGEDPRPRLGADLEDFVRANPGIPEAAEACVAAMDLYAEAREPQGFFRAWALALENAADEPGLRAAFEKVGLMRLVEAGGLGILISRDPAARARAWRQAAPRIVADMEAAIRATTSPETRAAAHYTIARTWYEMDLAPEKALLHFRIVAREYPGWPGAGSARMYVRELEDLAPGREAPGFTGETLGGGPLSLASYRGDVVLIEFWASWCDPCVDRIPHLSQVRRLYGDSGFEIIGVNLDDDPGAARQFVEAHGISWPIIARGRGMLDPLAQDYGVQSLPASWLLDRNGRIVARGLNGEAIRTAVGNAIAIPGEP